MKPLEPLWMHWDADSPLQTQVFERKVNVFCILTHEVTGLFQHLSDYIVKNKPIK